MPNFLSGLIGEELACWRREMSVILQPDWLKICIMGNGHSKP